MPIVLLTKDEVEVQRTWNPLGMRGTGSNRVTVEAVDVSADRIMYVMNPDETKLPGHPIGRLGSGTSLISLANATTMLGIARRALDEATGILRVKHAAGLQSTGDIQLKNPRILSELAHAEARWGLFHDGFECTLERLWLAACADKWPGPRATAAAVLAGASTSRACLDIVRSVYALCGSSATERGTPLERCFRDATTISTHGGVSPAQFERQGRLLYEVDTEE
jgi:alkylation response protein AidB-like acyl-CoA dehydrogenase